MTNTNPDSGSGADAHGIATAAELAAVREARGWSVQEAAQRMRLATRQIQALEQGQWAELPGGTFVRGALRGYGRLLGVGVEPLIDTLGAAGQPSDLRSAASLSEPMPRADGLDFSGSSGGRRNWLLLVVVTVAALDAFALFYGRSAPVGQTPAASAAPGNPASPNPVGSSPGQSQAASGPSEAFRDSAPSAGAVGAPGSAPAAAPSTSAPTVIENVPAQSLR
jgi:cytoskeleton protein RodZ